LQAQTLPDVGRIHTDGKYISAFQKKKRKKEKRTKEAVWSGSSQVLWTNFEHTSG
jgi:hypothetical protein